MANQYVSLLCFKLPGLAFDCKFAAGQQLLVGYLLIAS